MIENTRKMEQSIFYVDLTTTDDCNFNCSYCFEHGYFNKNYFSKVDLLIKRLEEIMTSSFFKQRYQLLGLGFWGGEPTLNEKVIKYLTDYYAQDNRVKLFIYSNGSNINPYMDLLEKFSNITISGHPKLCIQMSYDGKAIQDLCRKTKGGKSTTDLVRNNILRLYEKRIPNVIKSTVTLETFKYLPEARRDMLEIIESGDDNFFRSSNYFPTIDYYHIHEYTPEEIEQYYKELQASLTIIAREEIEYYKKNGRFFFSWFNENRALCSAGKDMVCVNWDGNVFKCHGAVYEDDSGEHFITNLEDDDFVSKIQDSHNLHANNFTDEPEYCRECAATFCLRCNSVKFDHSKLQVYIEKWRDYTNQPKLCDFYKLNGNIVYAISEIIQSEK